MNETVCHLPFDLSLPAFTRLQAGPVSAWFIEGNLRWISMGEEAILQMIYFAVRDEHWNTASVTILEQELTATNNGFLIRYTAAYSFGEDTVCQAALEIRGDAAGTIELTVTARALKDFRSNRIGICVHHPIQENRGKKLVLTKVDGQQTTEQFPEWVSPHQPFLDVKALKWTTARGTEWELEFQGDVFETEDQRNWTDSSYKTYSTPLRLPFPREIKKEAVSSQSVQLRISHQPEDTSYSVKKEKQGEFRYPFPAIGYCKVAGMPLLDTALLNAFRQLPFDHYRVELVMGEGKAAQELEEAVLEANLLNLKLELILYLRKDSSDAVISEGFMELLARNQDRVKSILIYEEGQPVSVAASVTTYGKRMRELLPEIQLGYGSDLFFAELNRQRPTAATNDFLCTALTPQVHASDMLSLAENLECQRDIMLTADSFAPGKSLWISPVTLKPRQPLAGGKKKHEPDPRQYSNWIAWWTLITIRNLARSGHLTLYETVGPAGLLQTAENGQLMLSPLYTVLQQIKAFQPAWIIENQEPEGLFNKKLVLENASGQRLIFQLDANVLKEV